MSVRLLDSRSREGSDERRVARSPRARRPGLVSLPRSSMISHALARIDWSDAYAVRVPPNAPCRDPQDWADAVFGGPPPWIRALFVVRELLVRTVGIEPSDGHAFDTVSRTGNEVVVGVDQDHLRFRASVLVERNRVVLTTVVELRNRRGAAYFALVRRIHPLIVRGMLARAAREMTTGRG